MRKDSATPEGSLVDGSGEHMFQPEAFLNVFQNERKGTGARASDA